MEWTWLTPAVGPEVNSVVPLALTVTAPALLVPSSVITMASLLAVPVTVKVAVAALNVMVAGTQRFSRASNCGRKRLRAEPDVRYRFISEPPEGNSKDCPGRPGEEGPGIRSCWR